MTNSPFNDDLILAKNRVSTLKDPEKTARLKHINQIAHDYSERAKFNNPKVFVSYNGEGGYQLAKEAELFLRKLPVNIDLPNGKKFGVETGFRQQRRDATHESDPSVIQHIKIMMQACCLYVGIVVDEYNVGDGRSVPGPWPMFEAGMAEALGLPVILMVQSDISSQYWKKIYYGKRLISFEKGKFGASLSFCATLAQKNYAIIRESL